jgi:hypothetical protein
MQYFYLLHLWYEIGAVDHTYCIDMNYYRIQFLLDAIMPTYCIRFAFDARRSDTIGSKISSVPTNPGSKADM